MSVVGVTGATGFIGGALLPFLVARGHTVRGLDNHSGPIRVDHPAIPTTTGDLRDPASFDVLSDCEVVLHLAATSGVMACAEDPVGSRRVNVEATQRLAEFCRERRIPLAFASSFAVVGVPDRLPIDESTSARPTHEYARQKAEGEQIVRSMGTRGPTPTAVLRMSNVYGRYQVGSRVVAKGNVLNLFADQAFSGALKVNAPGTQRRDFIHLDDVLAHWEAAARFLSSAGRPPAAHTFNLASGETSTMLELADRVAATFHGEFPDRPKLEIRVVPNPRGDVELLAPEFEVDRSRTERDLGVRCERTLARSIEEILSAVGREKGLTPAPAARNA